MGILKRCGTCGQLVDWDDLAEAVHHGPVPHKPMPGFTDDRAIQPQIDFVGPRPRSLADGPEGKWSPQPEPIYRDARKGRRKKSDFKH